MEYENEVLDLWHKLARPWRSGPCCLLTSTFGTLSKPRQQYHTSINSIIADFALYRWANVINFG
tara:strand:- start:45862 stop:46053 length:192 start_codon:yes stop_codon:yes gene_type:complete